MLSKTRELNTLKKQTKEKKNCVQDCLIPIHGRPEDIRLVVIVVTSLMLEARKGFSITAVREMAKTPTQKSVICEKLCSKPLEQLMGQILVLRLATGLPAFRKTATDMLGS